jgi:hypothetical protein
MPIPVAERSKLGVYDRSLAGTAVSIPAGGINACFECCVLSLRRADPSFRGVLPIVVCYCVWSRNLKNEAALAHVGLLIQRKYV